MWPTVLPPYYSESMVLCLHPVPHDIWGFAGLTVHVLPGTGLSVPSPHPATAFLVGSRSAECGDAPGAGPRIVLPCAPSRNCSSSHSARCFGDHRPPGRGGVLNPPPGAIWLHTLQSDTTSWPSSTYRDITTKHVTTYFIIKTRTLTVKGEVTESLATTAGM